MKSLKKIASLKLSKKQRRKLRDSFELWVDHHNHKMEVIRTLTGIVGVILSCIIMLKVFGVV